jgi:hypothetical protein
MRNFYHCDHCDETMPESDTSTVEDYVTSEFWGSRETQRVEYVVCGSCGGDVDECEEPPPLELNLCGDT